MSGQRRKSKQRRGGGGGGGNANRPNKTAPPAEFWRAAPELADPPDIVLARDPAALLRSMGPPPLPGHGSDAVGYFSFVAEKAARIASAVAKSADLLEDDDPDS